LVLQRFRHVGARADLEPAGGLHYDREMSVRLACVALTTAIAALCSTPAPAAAQTFVPPAPAPIVFPRRPPPPPEPPVDRWNGKGEVSYVATGGNTDTSTAKLAGEIEYKPALWAVLLRGAYLTSTTETGERNERTDGLLRASRAVTPRLDLFGQIVYLENTFAGIGRSFYPLAGVSYRLLTSPVHSLTGRFGFGYGQESRVRERNNTFATADSELNYRWRVSDTAELTQDATFTANLDTADDWRAASATAVSAALNSLFSLKLSLAASYLNAPVEGFGRIDTISSAALVARF
jgi:putative salt-induced outer membrane protein